MPGLRAVQIGRLGSFDIEAGRYAYVGSALNGLESRTRRHLTGGGRKRWHVDYLMAMAEDREALLFRSLSDIECTLAGRVRSLPGTSEPIAGFGSSDCRCRSHLFFLEEQTFDAVKRAFATAGEEEHQREQVPRLSWFAL